VLAVLSVLAPSASALVVHSARGRSFGVTLHRDTTATSVPGSVAAAHAAQLSRQVAGQPGGDTGTLTWHNGPVIHSSTPYLVFWTPSGESIDPSTQGLLSHYFTDVAADSTQASNVYAVARQYYDQSGFADYRQSFDPGTQVITDTAPYPSPDPSGACGGSIAATCLSDGQLSAELARLVAADGLPDDGASSSELPGGAPVYVIVLPSDVDVCLTSSVCASTTFCSYHSGSASPPYLLYAAIPLYPVLQDPKACQFDGQTAVQEPNQSVADVALRNLSHEQVEMVTDPMFTGWWDPLSGNEQADNCNAYGPFDPANGTNPDAFTPVLGGDPSLGTAYNQVINGDHYYLQSEWSNGDSACDMAPALPPWRRASAFPRVPSPPAAR